MVSVRANKSFVLLVWTNHVAVSAVCDKCPIMFAHTEPDIVY